MGYNACLKASEEEIRQGNIGAGTGATVGKILGGLRSMKSGLGTASFKSQELIVGVIAAEIMARAIVNAVKSAESLYGFLSYQDLA